MQCCAHSVGRPGARRQCAIGIGAMHANIISLERTPERAKELCSTLDTGGMPFTMFAAQDSLEAIPQLLLYWYVSPTNTSRSAQ